MTATSFVALRDDSGLRSLSTNERNFLRRCALGEESSRVLRVDGRKPGEVRKVQLNLGRWHNGAECTVQWGKAMRVTALVTAALVTPSSERPSEGVVSLSIDLSPMASTAFGHAQPMSTVPTGGEGGTLSSITDRSQKLLSNRILRALERTLLLGGALDTEALCVQSGAWVWKLNVSLTVLDQGGNLVDASVLAAMAALRHYRKPQVDLHSDLASSTSTITLPTLVHSEVREPTPLPLHHSPLSISFALIHADDAALSAASTSKVAVLVDPTDREELVQTGAISLAMNIHSEVCLLDYLGGCELQPEQLKRCWQLAERSIVQLCKLLEKALTDADSKAQQERLQRLQGAAGHVNAMPSVQPLSPNVPYLQDSSGQDFMDVDTQSEWTSVSADVESAVEHDEAEEKYRLRALDYSLGHVAAKVKDVENNDDRARPTSSTHAKAGSLLAAMLQSAQLSSVPVPPSASPDLRPHEAQDEFESFAATRKAAATTPRTSSANKKAKQSTATPMAIDDDEEEETPLLHSEFRRIDAETEVTKLTQTQAAVAEKQLALDEDDIDDLAMAVKKKSKKKKKR